MSTSETLFQQLKAMPNVALLIERINEELKNEAKQREAFYELVHEKVNAEFINGKIVMHSPVRRRHWKAVTRLSARLSRFSEENDLGEVGSEKVMIRLTRNDYEPDICFFHKARAAAFTDHQLLFPAPDFIVEVLSDSTKTNDYGVKMTDYAAHGVQEYWIIDPDEHFVEQYLLHEGEYRLNQRIVENGVIRSTVVAGFEAEISDLFR